MNARNQKIAAYLNSAVKRLKEALNGIDVLISDYAIPTDTLKQMFQDSNAIANTLRQLEESPEKADMVRIREAGAYADRYATMAECSKNQERKFLISLCVADNLYMRIVTMPNKFADPLLPKYMVYNLLRQNGVPLSEIRLAWLDLEKSVRAAEIALPTHLAREAEPANRVRQILASTKPVASASPKRINSRSGSEGLDAQLRAKLKGAHVEIQNSNGTSKKSRRKARKADRRNAA